MEREKKEESGGIEIILDEKYRISNDKCNIILDEKVIPKRGKFAGKETWKSISFHRTIDNAIFCWLKTRTNMSDANTAAKLITEWHKMIRSLNKIMKEYKRSKNEDK